MFYYKNWDRFCSWIEKSGIISCTAEESLTESAKKFVVLKHDVECNVEKAHRLAVIENKHGIRGSYYVQAYLLNTRGNVEILKRMQDLGHEISYHYDVLDANNGDYAKAEKDFDKWMAKFHEIGFSFKTICQHGNPVKKRIGYTSNRDFFRNSEIKGRHEKLVDMVVDYSNYQKQPYSYISDAGYSWKHITDPENNDKNPLAKDIKIGNFEKLEKFISASRGITIVSTHPHRWMNSPVKIYLKINIFRIVRFSAKKIQKVPFINSLMNRFYFLAKKI